LLGVGLFLPGDEDTSGPGVDVWLVLAAGVLLIWPEAIALLVFRTNQI